MGGGTDNFSEWVDVTVVNNTLQTGSHMAKFEGTNSITFTLNGEQVRGRGDGAAGQAGRPFWHRSRRRGCSQWRVCARAAEGVTASRAH